MSSFEKVTVTLHHIYNTLSRFTKICTNLTQKLRCQSVVAGDVLAHTAGVTFVGTESYSCPTEFTWSPSNCFELALTNLKVHAPVSLFFFTLLGCLLSLKSYWQIITKKSGERSLGMDQGGEASICQRLESSCLQRLMSVGLSDILQVFRNSADCE